MRGARMRDPSTQPWAQILSLGEARFGILAGGPFDGRCYPLPDGDIPDQLSVPGPRGPGQPTGTPGPHDPPYLLPEPTSRTLWAALILLLPFVGGRPDQRR